MDHLQQVYMMPDWTFEESEFDDPTVEGKEKVGERIAALQELVSPFGKTDTASVLLEAMGYISFLHEQVKVLSAPYLHSTSLEIIQGSESYNLRSKGLCLVPISCTAGVASTNGLPIFRLLLPKAFPPNTRRP